MDRRYGGTLQSAMTLHKDSVKWAIDFICKHSDGDIFPSLPEMSLIASDPQGLIDALADRQLTDFHPQNSRRFIVPKEKLSYRRATQLHPQDSILLTALVYQYGQGIEDRRLPKEFVFSYRFNPTAEQGLYGPEGLWNDFWTTAFKKVKHYPVVLYCDIADFYNQIYHHTVENQLRESGFPKPEVKWIIDLFGETTAGVSRGIPIGPHAAHLIAESTLIPIDNSLRANGIEFLRYADDILVFCHTEEEATSSLQIIAHSLDQQQKLMVQNQKTKIFGKEEFEEHCRRMIEDRPVNEEENKILDIIRKYSGGNPYAMVTYNQISDEDWQAFASEIVEKIVSEYLSSEEVDYVRLRWFFRRLAQVGHPGAMQVVIDKIGLLEPCIPSVCSYITSIQNIPPDEWEKIGDSLLGFLETDQVLTSEFARLSILSLFSKNEHVDHFARLARRFGESDSFSRREILLAAYTNAEADWLREHKESYASMDAWQKLAFVLCASILPQDERGFFLRRQNHNSCFDKHLNGLARKGTKVI